MARKLLVQLLDEAAEDVPPDAKLPELACRIHSSRRVRRKFFPDDLFADPAWDMILSLFCAENRGEFLSVTSLGYSVGLPQATAARWIASLTRAGLIEQQQDDRDRRRKFVTLSPRARDNVTSWLKHVDAVLEPNFHSSEQADL